MFAGAGGGLGRAEPDEKTIDDHLAVQAIIRSYQVKMSTSEIIVRTLHTTRHDIINAIFENNNLIIVHRARALRVSQTFLYIVSIFIHRSHISLCIVESNQFYNFVALLKKHTLTPTTLFHRIKQRMHDLYNFNKNHAVFYFIFVHTNSYLKKHEHFLVVRANDFRAKKISFKKNLILFSYVIRA